MNLKCRHCGEEAPIRRAVMVVVRDAEGRVLWTQRQDNQMWDCPGGMVERGESIENAAEREVLEETGLAIGKLEFLGTFIKWSDQKRCWIMGYAFAACAVNHDVTPQPSEVRDWVWSAVVPFPAGPLARRVALVAREWVSGQRKSFVSEFIAEGGAV